MATTSEKLTHEELGRLKTELAHVLSAKGFMLAKQALDRLEFFEQIAAPIRKATFTVNTEKP